MLGHPGVKGVDRQVILPAQQLKFAFGHDEVEESRFGADRAVAMIRRYNSGSFHCKTRVCGVKPFYTPRSNPDGVDINVHCLDTAPQAVHVTEFDGQNWERHAHELAHKSQDD